MGGAARGFMGHFLMRYLPRAVLHAVRAVQRFLLDAVRHYLLALQFFTRIPVTGAVARWVGFSAVMLRASAAHFPGVGWLLGGVLAAFAAVLLAALPAGPLAALVVACLTGALSLMLTGALHEDGLADVADGLGSGQERGRALAIMKDSRVGAFGAIAVATALLVRVALVAQLAALGVPALVFGLFMAQVSSRVWPLFIIRLLPHVGEADGSKSKPLADQITCASLAVALVWCLLAVALPVLLEHTGLAPWVAPHWGSLLVGGTGASAVVWLWLWRWFARRLQGFTGDCLGTVQMLCELAFYLGCALAWGAA